MNKLLLTTALITSLSSIAIAEITITGEAKVNSRNGDHYIKTDLTITGKSGDTSVVAQLGLDNSQWGGDVVEQLYMHSKVSGIGIKVGNWKWRKDDGELNVNNDSAYTKRIEVNTSFGGIDLTYRDFTGAGGTHIDVSSLIGGVKFMHREKVYDNRSETKVSGSIGDINIDFHTRDQQAGGTDQSWKFSTSVQGIDFTYVDTRSDAGINMDGYIGKYHGVTDATASGISTTIAGNKITYKDIMVNDVDSQKLILTRKIASGATFEAIYRRDSADPAGDWLDLELAVKF